MGKTSQTTQQVSIPPEVLARYNAVNARAEQTAATPFQQYSTDPSAFVAPINQVQQQGINQTQQYAQSAQPYYDAATAQLMGAQAQGQYGLAQAYPMMQQGVQTGQQLGQQAYGGYQSMLPAFMPSFQQAQQGIQQGLGAGRALMGGGLGYALAGSEAVNPQQFSGQAVGQYMSPYLNNVVGQTMAAQAQQNAQQRQALNTEAIKAGAFGGDRSGIAQANLAYQQNLANQQTIANLYNQGYGQALGAFQQQQGVDLAAQQANRQALQQTGQALAGLGQQAFGMGTGAAQQQAGLGQALAGLYGTQAQGLQGLGQQQFGQGMTAAQQQAQLAQQGYGMGAGTAQALAGLGQGAQAAGLQGAQAAIQAGTLQQQTEQAGKQALYNQFLQQQSYPFQVAQFLANIAMGTGALSGSTTTTTQPTGWSDRKLKENIRKIGETEDGLPIHKFNYKGDKKEHTHIGYMADEVEKKHPDAVGEKDGYKYVDYSKVNARESMGGAVHDGGLGRAAFTGGGSIVSESELQRLQQSLTSPFTGYTGDKSKGLAGALPHGGSSYVPQSNVAVSKLITPSSPPPAPKSALKEAESYYNTGERLLGTALGQYNPETEQYEGGVMDKLSSLGDKFSEYFSKPAAARGGIIPRQHAFEGGDIYKPKDDYFPQDVLDDADKKKPELMTAKGGAGGGGGGGGGLGSKLGSAIGGALGSFIPIPGVGTALGSAIGGIGGSFLPFNEGGVVPRGHYDNGGEAPRYKIEPQNLEDMPEHRQAMIKAIYGPESGGRYDIRYGGVGSTGKTFDTEGFHPNIREARDDGRYSTAAGAGQFIKGTWDAVTGGAPMTKGYQDAATWKLASDDYARRTGRDLDADLKEKGVTPEIKSALAPTWEAFAKQGARGLEGGRQANVATMQTAPEQGGIGKAASSLGDLWSSFSKYAAPIGKGIAAAAGSSSPKASVAIAQGIGAGLAAMQPAEAAQAQIKKIGEESGLVEAQKQAVQGAISKGAAIFGPAGQLLGFRVYINGKITQVSPQEFMRAQREGRPYQTAPEPGYTGGAGSQTAPGGTGAATTATTQTTPGGAAGASDAGKAPQIGQRGAEAAPPYLGLDQSLKTSLDKMIDYVDTVGPDQMKNDKSAQPFNSQAALASQVQSQTTNRNQYVNAIASIDPSYTGNFAEKIKTPVLQWATSTGRAFGIPDSVINSLASLDQLSNTEVLDKIRKSASFDRTDAVQQRSFEAFMASLSALPGQANSPKAAATLAADLMISAQRQIDLNNFYNQVRDYASQRAGTPGTDQYVGRGLENEFMRRQQDTYAAEKKALADMRFTNVTVPDANGKMQNMNLLQYLSSTGGNVNPKLRASIEKEFGPNILRYFEGR